MEIKPKDFIDVVSIMPYQNPLRIMGLKIYVEGRIQIPLSSLTTICPLAKIQEFHFDIKIANNTKNNPIMISFTDYYNAIEFP